MSSALLYDITAVVTIIRQAFLIEVGTRGGPKKDFPSGSGLSSLAGCHVDNCPQPHTIFMRVDDYYFLSILQTLCEQFPLTALSERLQPTLKAAATCCTTKHRTAVSNGKNIGQE